MKLLWLFAAAVSLYGAATPDVQTIVRRSVEVNQRDWAAAPGYSYLEVDQTGHGSKMYRVTMIDGSPYSRLVEINGHPLSAAAEAAEQRKQAAVTARRRAESPAQRARRVADYKRGRERDHQMIQQLTRAFNFRLSGQQSIGSRRVYVLDATPRPGYQPPNRDSRVLTGMRGKLWVDTQTFQWVKVQADVVHPVWISGFLARVDPGTRFLLDYAPVSDSIWLPSHFQMHAQAKVMLVFSHREDQDQSFSGYEKISR